MNVMHGYCPLILSMDIIHRYHPWILSMDIIHGYHPWIISIDFTHGIPWGGTMGTPWVGSLSLLGLMGPLGPTFDQCLSYPWIISTENIHG